MGRAKARMELITNEKTRKTTYENRKNGIMKKAKELSVLCDVNTSIIIYPPPHHSNHPEIWPQNPHQINHTITSYKATKNNQNDKRMMMYDLDYYFQDRKRKIEDELVKTRKRNKEAKYPTWFDDLNGLSEGQLRQFALGLENKEKIVRDHLQIKKTKLNPNHYSYLSSHNHDLGRFDDAPKMSLGFGLEKNQPVAKSCDQVEDLDDDLMRQIDEWFDDPENAKMACGLDDLLPSLDQVQVLNQGLMSQDAPNSSFVPLKPAVGGFGYHVFEGDVVYDNSKAACVFQPVEQCGLMPYRRN